MGTVVHHSTLELREGLHGALSGAITPQLRKLNPSCASPDSSPTSPVSLQPDDASSVVWSDDGWRRAA